jgi:hypothetical protein
MNFGEVWTERLSVLRLGNNINVIARINGMDAIRLKLEPCEHCLIRPVEIMLTPLPCYDLGACLTH